MAASSRRCVGLVLCLLGCVLRTHAEEPPSVDDLVQAFPVFDTIKRPDHSFRVRVESIQKGEGAGFALTYRSSREYSLIYYDAADQTPLLVGTQDGILAYDSTSSSVVLLKQRQASLRFRPSGPIPVLNQPPASEGGLMLEFRVGLEPTGPNVQIDLRAVVDDLLSDEALTPDRPATPGAVVRYLAEREPAYEVAFEPANTKSLRAKSFKTLGTDPSTRLEFLLMASGPEAVPKDFRPPSLDSIATALARKGVDVIRLGVDPETANKLTMRLMMGPIIRGAFRHPDSRERVDGLLGVRFNWEKARILDRTYSETIRKEVQIKLEK